MNPFVRDMKKILGIAGLVGAGGVLIGAAKPISHRIEKTLNEKMDPEYTRNARYMSTASGVTATAAEYLIDGVNKNHLRKQLFLGGNFLATTSYDIAKGDDIGTAITTGVLTGMLGMLVHTGSNNAQKKIYSNLTTLLRDRGAGKFVEKMESSYASVLTKAPLLKGLLSSETIPMLVAVGAMPLTHSVAKYAVVKGRKAANYFHSTLLGETVENQAGEQEPLGDRAGPRKLPDSGAIHKGRRMTTHVVEKH